MEKPLISFEEYEFFRKTGRPYEGYVWTKEGKIYYVEEQLLTVVQPKPAPPLKSYGDSYRVVFFDVIKHPEISSVNLGSNDVLYNMNGDFVSVIEAKDSVKGEIKILKSQINFSLPFSWSEEQRKEYEIVDLKNITLSAEAYSKIFTHILSLMDDVDLSKVRGGKVGVELRKSSTDVSIYNLDGPRETDNAEAYYSSKQNVLAAVIRTHSDSNKELYHTLWNVQNMLGAHEFIGHKKKGWGDYSHHTHHLVYLFQMSHWTWEKTTKYFKNFQENNLDSYYIEELSDEYDTKKNKDNEKKDMRYYKPDLVKDLSRQRALGLFPKGKMYNIPDSDLKRNRAQFNQKFIEKFRDNPNFNFRFPE